jgi:hypothetical protein
VPGPRKCDRLDVALPRHVTQIFARDDARRNRISRHRVQNLALASTEFLDSVGIAIQHFQDWQWLQAGWQLLGHAICRGQRHERVESDVILPAERAGIG